jgi:hypothetical protein
MTRIRLVHVLTVLTFVQQFDERRWADEAANVRGEHPVVTAMHDLSWAKLRLGSMIDTLSA